MPFVYLPQRAVLELKGPDTIELLERLVTNNTADWPTGVARYGALLTPQGKILSDFLALRTETGVLLDVPADGLADLKKRLTLFRLRADVSIDPREDLFVIAGTEPADDGVRPISGTAFVFLDERFGGARLRAFADREEWAAWHGPHPAEWSRPLPDYHGDRIHNCVPEWGADFESASVFPADINMDALGGVDLKKGCFVGQEVVSRMHRKGRIRRRTLVVEGNGLAPGADLVAANPVGTVTSVEGRFGLARVRIDRLAQSEGSLVCNDQPVTLHLPEWLEAEMAASGQHG